MSLYLYNRACAASLSVLPKVHTLPICKRGLLLQMNTELSNHIDTTYRNFFSTFKGAKFSA